MDDALERGLIDHPLNTYEANGIFLIYIWSASKITNIIEVNTTLFRNVYDDIREELILESNLINVARNEFKRVITTPEELLIYQEYIAPEPVKEPIGE